MAIDRTDIIEAELLEERAAGEEAARQLFGPAGAFEDEGRHFLGDLLAPLAQAPIGPAREKPRQIGRQRADRGRDGHVVIVEDHDEARVHGACIVHGLIGHARGHGAIADHRDDIVLASLQIARDGHAKARRNRGRGMGGAKGVVFALRALGEARETIGLAQGADAVAAPGEDLVGIGLMAHVPDQAIFGRVEGVMQRHRQFDDAKARAQMTTGDGHRADGLATQFVGDLRQFLLREFAQIRRQMDRVEQGGLTLSHGWPHLLAPMARGECGLAKRAATGSRGYGVARDHWR